MLSHASDSAAYLCWRRRRQGDLATVRYRCRVMLVTVLLSLAGDGATRMTWPRHDVDAESC
jgi:hypothetical protein